MKNLKHYLVIDFLLAVISIIALVFIHMALTDIHHGAEDLTLEWNIVRVCIGIIWIFVLFTIFTIIKAFRFGVFKKEKSLGDL